MEVSDSSIKAFVNSNAKNKEVLTQAYGFINGFVKSVNLPNALAGPLTSLRDDMDLYVGDLDMLADSSSAGW